VSKRDRIHGVKGPECFHFILKNKKWEKREERSIGPPQKIEGQRSPKLKNNACFTPRKFTGKPPFDMGRSRKEKDRRFLSIAGCDSELEGGGMKKEMEKGRGEGLEKFVLRGASKVAKKRRGRGSWTDFELTLEVLVKLQKGREGVKKKRSE